MDLIEFWEKLNIEEQKTFVHPDDINLIDINLGKNYKNTYCYDDYINKNPNFGDDEYKSYFHFNLIPIPYIGDIKNAKIYILMLNPGFGILDYYAESKDKELKNSLIDNLHQKGLDPSYPFIFLNPKFLWHGGGQYYENKFKWLIKEVKDDKSYTQKLSYIAKKVAILQLVPYHSKSYHSKSYLPIKLESSKIMLDFVEKELVPKAKDDKICIICPRGEKYWEEATDNKEAFVCPEKKKQQPRAVHISKNTFGGEKWEKIIKFLK